MYAARGDPSRHASRYHIKTLSCNAHTAGQHGFNGNRSGSVLLAPGMHAFEVDYSQVEPLLLCCA